jgi:hypothetical protein
MSVRLIPAIAGIDGETENRLSDNGEKTPWRSNLYPAKKLFSVILRDMRCATPT